MPTEDDRCTCPDFPHTCPYSEDLYGDFETECDCCAYCEQQCKDDI